MNGKQDSTGVPTSSKRRVRTRREIVRRRRRERQVIFFGLVLLVVAVVAVGAGMIFTGRTAGLFAEPLVTPAPDFEGTNRLVCPPNGALPLDPSQVAVRTLNSTEQSGLARSVLDDLTGRGYVPLAATNWNRGVYEGVARISFGKNGILDAYTVAREFPEYELVLDTRSNGTVDVVLGLGFEDLVPLYDPSRDAEIPLTAPAQCNPLVSEVLAEPAPANVLADPTETAEPSPTASPEEEVVLDPGENAD